MTTVGGDMTPGRTRPSWSERKAAVALLLRAAAGGRPLPAHIRAVAVQHGVGTGAVRAWLRDPALVDPAAERPAPKRKKPVFVVTRDHLAVLTQEQNAQDAHGVLERAGLIDCSYETFARALRERTDPALVASALTGHKGLVNNRGYLRSVAPHRGHTWHFDHTKADLWVLPSHRHALPVRPYLSVVADDATSYNLALVGSVDPVNAEKVTALIAQAADVREEHGAEVGGLPSVLVFDNAREHHSAALHQGCSRFGIVPDPTDNYSPWQNGKAERGIGLVMQKLAAKAPGATAKQAGTVRNGDARFVARSAELIQPGDVLSMRAFELLLEGVRDEINTKYRVRRLGGLTRAQAWAADPTELVQVDEKAVAHAMLKAGKAHAVNGDGIHFRNRTYTAPEMVGLRGRHFNVRYLPTNRDYIEVFGLDGENLFRATDMERLTPQQKSAFMRARRTQEQEAAAVEYGVRAHRKQLAAAINELVGTEDTEHGTADALDAAVTPDAGPAEPDDGIDRQVRAARRPKLPRVPATTDPGQPGEDTARARAVERLRGLAERPAVAIPDDTAVGDTAAGDTGPDGAR